MRRPFLLAALLVGLTAQATLAQADQRRVHEGRHGHPHLQAGPGPQIGFMQPDWPSEGVLPVFPQLRPWWWRTTPWRYYPQGLCPPPWCLPGFLRYRGFLVDPRAVPLEAVLERLQRQGYHSFGDVFLFGPHYNIIARNRYGQVVRLIVNAGNGQIRQIIP